MPNLRYQSASVADDGRDIRQGFHIIDQGRHIPQAIGGGVGRAGARFAAFAFDRLDQGSFFTADIGARAGMDMHVKVKAGAKDILAQQPEFAGLFDCQPQALLGQEIFAADIDIGFVAPTA